MGQHSGSGTAGTKGLAKALQATRIIENGIPAVVDPFDPNIGDQIDISKLAMGNVELSIKTLARVMRSPKASATAKVSAATKTLEFAGGRPGAKEQERRDTGIQITVNYLFVKPGEPKPVIDITPATAAQEIEDAEYAERSQPHDPTPDLLEGGG